MDAIAPLTDTTTSVLALADFLKETNSQFSCSQALSEAVGNWIAEQRAAAKPSREPSPDADRAGRGYQWKCLFLPEGTELRMSYTGRDFFARVGGNAIDYQGERLTPRQFTLAVAGDGRNAWRDLWVRQPGEKSWTRAQTLRRRIEQRQANAPVSPLDAMREAAACMSDTLKSALALVEHANRSAAIQDERRKLRARRTEDVLGETCKFD
jgi:hypothetical protein